MSDVKLKAKLAVAGIFIVGILIGMLISSLYHTQALGSRWDKYRGERLVRRPPVEWLARKLNLSPDQVQQLRRVLEETKSEYARLGQEVWPRYKEIRERSRQRIRGILTPEQQKIYDEMIKREDERVRRRWERMRR